MIQIERYNEVHIKVLCDRSTGQEITDFFTFTVPGAKFSPAYRNRVWDGKIRLFNYSTGLLYAGLLPHLKEFCRTRDYDVELESDFSDNDFSLVEAKEFIEELKLPYEVRDYQLEAFTHCVRKDRALCVSPTASGKSLIIYMLQQWYGVKSLIIVPTTSLVHQMASDFESYGYKDDIHRITAGVDKHTDNMVTVTTWQSIYKMPKKWFQQFELVVGDEAHLFKAKSLTTIMTKLYDCKYRFGFTGTLDGTQTNKLVLEGLFGAVKKVTTTAELIDEGHVANLNIKCIVLEYEDEIRRTYCKALYQDETSYIESNPDRHMFLANLSLSLKGNSLILFKTLDHGRALETLISPRANNVFYVDGSVKAEDREHIRKAVDSGDGCIIIASYGTFSTGINIRNLHNIIFASPSKSRIRNLQSIGRGLRLGEYKTAAVLYDVADNLTWKQKKNHTITHFAERINIYNQEKFDYKIYNVGLKNVSNTNQIS